MGENMKSSTRHNFDNTCFLSDIPPGNAPGFILDEGTELMNGRYRLGRHLATGSSAHLYVCQDMNRQEEIAIKVFTANSRAAENGWQAARNEALLYTSVSNTEHIVCAYDFHICSYGATKLFVIPMQYAEGGTLRNWLAQNGPDTDFRREKGIIHIREISLGLQALHNDGIYHLDLKPENIVFSWDNLKIIDLGTFAWLKTILDEKGIDHPGYIFPPASPEYMAPELYTASYLQDISPMADIYSLGVMLYEILHPQGQLPFRGSPNRLCTLHAHASVPPIPGLSHRAMEIITRCLQKDPADRYQSVAEIIEELDSLQLNVSESGPNMSPGATELYEKIHDHTNAVGLRELWQLFQAIQPVASEQNLIDEMYDELEKRTTDYHRIIQNGIDALKVFQWTTAQDYFENASTMNTPDTTAKQLAILIGRICNTSLLKARQIKKHLIHGETKPAREIAENTDYWITRICNCVQG